MRSIKIEEVNFKKICLNLGNQLLLSRAFGYLLNRFKLQQMELAV